MNTRKEGTQLPPPTRFTRLGLSVRLKLGRYIEDGKRNSRLDFRDRPGSVSGSRSF